MKSCIADVSQSVMIQTMLVDEVIQDIFNIAT